MPFFDFHCHPGIKPQFSDPANKPSPWDIINAKLAIFKDVNISINKLFNEVLNSQSCLTQLVETDVKLIGVILHAIEQKIGQVLGEQKIVNKGKISLINKTQLAYLASGVHSFELINTELKSLKDATAPAGLSGASFKIINKTTEFDETAPNTVYGVIIIEGLHCFFGDPNAMDAKIVFKQNFDLFTNDNTVLAINLCHMQQNPFCNHAHGIQFFTPSYFYPTGKGISLWGKEIIQAMMDKKILADIKHTSLLSRIELYEMLKDPADLTKFVQPIICTHAGTTGFHSKERVKYLLRPPVDKGSVYEVTYMKPKSRHDAATYHNCSSINLYDDDIQTILLSGGIIGLSFDQRILGFADESVMPGLTVPHDVEYISHQEADFFLGTDPSILESWTDDSAVWVAEDLEDLDPSLLGEMHMRFLINNIIHILWVANKHPDINLKKAAKQICIGTDFDGLINAIDCCKLSTGLPQLKADMLDGMELLLNTEGLDALDAAQLLDDIFYNNGKNFVMSRLKLMRG